MKKIKLLLISCILVLTFVLGGCMRTETAFVVDENDTVTITMKYAFHKEKANAALTKMSGEIGMEITPKDVFEDFSEETIHGEKYYVSSESQKYTQKELEETGLPVLVNKDKFYFYAAAGMEKEFGNDISEMEKELQAMGLSLYDIEYVEYSVKLPSPIVTTNGEQKDSNTVVWEFTDFSTQEAQEYELYAYTANDPADRDADRQKVLKLINDLANDLSSTSSGNTKPSTSGSNTSGNSNTNVSKDTKAPVIKGIKKNKTYKKKVTVYVKDNKKLKKVTVNGKKAKLKKVKKGKYKGYFKFTVKKKGKKTIIAYDTAGNKKKISIKIK